MELIFFYVNQSRTKFIEKQGFNFSSRYKFSVEYDKGTYILKGFECENPLPQNFFDETGCITNVTAVVGENGSGKTTLLTKLLGYSGQVKDKDHAPEYDAFFAEEKVFYSQIALPKFIWVCEYGTSKTYMNHKILGEIVLDATSAKHHIFESVISVRNGDSVTYRGPADPNSYVHLRRKLPMEKEFAMYEENNLKRIC